MKKHPLVWSALLVLLAIVFAWLAPLEQTLGTKARFVYFHGAWVWTGILGFILAAVLGAAGLITRRSPIQQWSRAWGRTSLFFWLLFLPMSLYAMQANWGGLFLDEPRWQIPLNLAIIGLLLQVGLAFFPLIWSAVGNLLLACTSSGACGAPRRCCIRIRQSSTQKRAAFRSFILAWF